MSEIVVAIVTASGSIVVAALSYYLTKRHERAVRIQDDKLNHYKVMFSALSDMVTENESMESRKRFALACNTIVLVAPQDVITALMAFREYISGSNPNKSQERHDDLLKALILAIRKDIGRARGDSASSFSFRFYKP